jgi:segregation and condensation protein B
MSDEQRRDSLADQAAAWVPPWERPRPPAARRPEADDRGSERPEKEPDPATIPATPVPVSANGQPETGGAERPEETGEADETAGVQRPETAGETGEPGGAAEASQDAKAGGAADPPRRQPAGRRRVAPAPEPAPVLDDGELRGALEAILLVVDEPVSELTLAQVLEQSPERVGAMLDEIAAGYAAAGHGFELRRAAGGWRLYTRPEYATYVERFVLDGQSVRLTQAALETLAIVAYKQPVTRSRISAIRGVNCDGVIRTLVSRGLVEECGTEPDSGAFLYRTTTLFLEKLGLNSLDELPPLAPFLPDDVEELADAT